MADPSVPPDLTPRHCVLNALHQAARAVGRRYAAALRPYGLKRDQFAVLAALSGVGELPVQALAERLVIDRTSLSRQLRPLEQADPPENRSA